jgi:hypothetical protein
MNEPRQAVGLPEGKGDKIYSTMQAGNRKEEAYQGDSSIMHIHKKVCCTIHDNGWIEDQT